MGRLGWTELSERDWIELVECGLPVQLAELSCDLSRRNRRPIRVFTLPTQEAGVEGLAVPFMDEDGILFDPSLLGHPDELTRVISKELAYMLYPGWSHPYAEDHLQMAEFAALLAPILLRQLPSAVSQTRPMVELTLCSLRGSATS